MAFDESGKFLNIEELSRIPKVSLKFNTPLMTSQPKKLQQNHQIGL